MLKENHNRDVYVCSHSEKPSEKAHMFFVNHLAKFGLIVILFLISVFITDRQSFTQKFIAFSIFL
jgi:heme/copper-type cytochrome/quinol oxidase subunit 4